MFLIIRLCIVSVIILANYCYGVTIQPEKLNNILSLEKNHEENKKYVDKS